MKRYYKIVYKYSEEGQEVVCRIYKGTHPTRTREYRLCKLSFEDGYIHSYGFERLTPEEEHAVKTANLLRVNNITLTTFN